MPYLLLARRRPGLARAEGHDRRRRGAHRRRADPRSSMRRCSSCVRTP
jgi:hypothetical protein